MSAVADESLGLPHGVEARPHHLPDETDDSPFSPVEATAPAEAAEEDLEALADDDFDDEFDDDFEAELGGEYDFDDGAAGSCGEIDLELPDLEAAACGDIREAFEETETDEAGDLDPEDNFGDNEGS